MSLPHRLRAPDFEVVEEAVFAHAAELDLRLRCVGDAGGLEEGHGLAVDGGAHRVAHGFEHEAVPGLGIEAEREAGVFAAFRGRGLAGGAFGAGHGQALLIHEGDLVRRDARHAEVPVVRAVELPVVKLRRHRLRAAQPEAELDHAVLCRDVIADHRLMPLHRRLALLRRRVKAHLRALQRTVLQGKRRHHDGPALVLAQLRPLKVIGKEHLLLLRRRLCGDGRQLRRISSEGGGGEKAGQGEEAEVHGGDGTHCARMFVSASSKNARLFLEIYAYASAVGPVNLEARAPVDSFSVSRIPIFSHRSRDALATKMMTPSFTTQ